MHSSKKALLRSAAVVLIVVLFSVLLSFFVPSEELELRNSLAGSLDYLIVGASQAQCSFVPAIIDEKLGVNSYNLSIGSMTSSDKLIMLEEEIYRNPVDTAVIEISYNAFSRTNKNNAADGNFHMFNRIGSFRRKADYLMKNTPFDNWAYVYSRSMMTGISALLSGPETVDASQKGYTALKSKDFSLGDDKIIETYKSSDILIDSFYDDSVSDFIRMLHLCGENGIRAIVTVVPVGDSFIWEQNNIDEFSYWIENICMSNEAEYFDFNLIKTRYDLFSDSTSYSTNSDHLSEDGAWAFSELFADTMLRVNSGEDVSGLFYSSYEEMLEDSPYMEYYLEHVDE